MAHCAPKPPLRRKMMLPYSLERRQSVLIVAAIATTFLWLLLWQSRHAESAATIIHERPSKLSQHPVERLIEQARISYVETIWRQSTTLEEAIIAYRARYDLDPPPGFAKWFEYAVEQGSPIIDDYDTIYDSIAPYLAINGQRLQELVQEAMSNTTRLYKCGFSNGTAVGHCGKWDIGVYMKPVAHLMPDVELLFSDFDEPRVLLSTDAHIQQQRALFTYRGHEDNTERFYSACSPETKPLSPNDLPLQPLPFVHDIRQANSLCANPSYSTQHGFIMSPSTLIVTQQAVPILSQTAPDAFNDILYPIPYYAIHNTSNDYDPVTEPEWSDKHRTLYWAGSATGGYFSTPAWSHSHRQRFITQAHNLHNTPSTFLRQPRPGDWESYTSTTDLTSLYTAHLTNIYPHLCSPSTCAEQEAFFHPTLSAQREPDEQFQHRLLMDLDGNSYSGRFYAHLRSKSTSFKQTIFREWHDDRLWPWVHYVPVSMGLEELPELVRWMTSTEKGEVYAKEIAEEGAAWMGRALREVDMRVYMWRVVLEYRRLMDPGRKGDGAGKGPRKVF